MNIYMLGLLFFGMTIAVIELQQLAECRIRSPQRAKIRKRLRKYAYEENPASRADILHRRVLSYIPFMDRMLRRIAPVRELDRLISQVNAPHATGFYILLTVFLAFLGFLLSDMILKQPTLAILIGFLGAGLPYLYLQSKKRTRLERFREQMPEALGLVARSLKTRHALPSGMKLAADQFEDPLGPELSETLDEINSGVSAADALKNLAERMPCQEVRYFVTAVILQRETGGNSAELMEGLSTLIPENYKFQGKVRTLSAEGCL